MRSPIGEREALHICNVGRSSWFLISAPVALAPAVLPTVTVNLEGATTMTSREIAELTGKEHFHVKRDIKVMLEQLGEDASSFGGMSHDAYGRPLEVFHLPKDLTITLVSGYSAPMRHRIVTRWMELEAAKAPTGGA